MKHYRLLSCLRYFSRWRSVPFLEYVVIWLQRTECPKHPLFIRNVTAQVSTQPFVVVGLLLTRVFSMEFDHFNEIIGHLLVSGWLEARQKFHVLQLWTVTLSSENFHQKFLRHKCVFLIRKVEAVLNSGIVKVLGGFKNPKTPRYYYILN